MSPEEICVFVADATSLREGPEGVLRIIHTVISSGEGGISTKSLARATLLPLPIVAAVRRELEKQDIFSRHFSGVVISEAGKSLFSASLRPSIRCSACQGKGLVIPPDFAPLLETIAQLFSHRPPADVRLDQSKCLPETAIRRALYVHAHTPLSKVLVLGDDDFFSIALALYARHIGKLKNLSIFVVEMDQRIVEAIQNLAESLDLPIKLLAHDLRLPLPKELYDQFDCIQTDPPYTKEGLSLFLSRGIQALDHMPGRPIFLSFGHRSPEEIVEITRMLTEMNLAIVEMMPRFNEYEGSDILGNMSQMIFLRTTAKTKQKELKSTTAKTKQKELKSTDQNHEATLYTHDDHPLHVLYRCTRCGFKEWIGDGRPYVTISSLKQSGCATCGGRSFRRIKRKDVIAKEEKTGDKS